MNSEIWYQKAVSFANLIVWKYDPVKHIFYDDDGCIEDLGIVDCEAEVPQSLFDANVIAEESKESFQKIFDDIEKGIEGVTYEIWVITPKLLQRKCLKITFFLEKDEYGKVMIGHGVAQDITELKNAEEEYKVRLNSVFRMNSDMVSNFSGNVTKNECGRGRSIYSNIEKLQNKGTMFRSVAERV